MSVLEATGTGTGIHIASIERLNATFRSHLTPLARRGRAIAHLRATLEAGMWLVGTSYNLSWLHDSLQSEAPVASGRRWLERTPAMAAGLTDIPGHSGTSCPTACHRLLGLLRSGVAAHPSKSSSSRCHDQPDPGSMVAHAAVYLASDEAAFVHGTAIDVDGGRVGVAVIAAD